MLGFERELRCNGLLCSLMLDFSRSRIGNDLIEWLGPLDRGATDRFVFGRRIFFQFYLGKESRGLVVLILCPLFEGVVVAFVAIEAYS